MEFIVGDYFYETDYNIKFKDTTKKIKIVLTSDEMKIIEDIFKSQTVIEEQKATFIEQKIRLNKLLTIETDKVEIRKLIKDLESIEIEEKELKETVEQQNLEQNDEFEKMVFKDNLQYLKANMPSSEYDRLSEQVGLDLVGEYLAKKKEQYMNMNRQLDGNN